MQWGHCEHCKYFSSPSRRPEPTEEAQCRHPVLASFDLKVFGACGCRGFELRPGVSRDSEEPASPQVIP